MEIPTDPGAGAAHELLGLNADERDPVRIVEAAARLRPAMKSPLAGW